MMRVVTITCLALVSAGSILYASPPQPGRAVWPRTAAALPPIALSELIFRAIPSRPTMEWTMLQLPSVRWTTDGVAYGAGDRSAYRIGLVRARANGEVTTLLRQRVEELAWTLELSTEGNEKWGPTSLHISPGLSDPAYKGNYICFGTNFTGCDFPQSAIQSPKIKYARQCVIGSLGNQSVVMRATTTDGRRGTVIYSGSGGSGGFSNSVEISTLSPAEYCETNKDRGY